MGMPLPSAATSAQGNGPQESTSISPSMVNISTLSAEEARQMALQLAEKRREIDEEVDAHAHTLKSNDATMTSRLVDQEGFPIASIDIVAIRTARARLIALRNDREDVEHQMRQLLEVALARQANQSNGVAQESDSSIAMAHVPGTNGALSTSILVDHTASEQSWGQIGGLIPFALVDSVAPSSPASQADLRIHDKILKFGRIVASSAHRSPSRRDLGNLPSAVTEDAQIEVLVLRTQGTVSSVKRLQLTPSSRWGGRGLLGCHLVPL